MLQVNIDSFSYSQKQILSNISFQVEKGEHLFVLGESGCGKSTLLHIIYGLLELEHGSLFWEDKALLGPTHNLVPGELFMKLVAQEFNVMPYISVAENIATHLSRLDQVKDNARVEELLQVVDLQPYKDTMVKNLSGGQKQRVALAKALANKPTVLLLDEPFSSIDSFRKNKLRRKLFGYLKKQGITCITATHDSEEALSFADRIMLLKHGEVVTHDLPEKVYHKANTVYEKSFFGEVSEIPKGMLSTEKRILLPHQLEISKAETPLQVIIRNSFYKGYYYLIEAKAENTTVFFNHNKRLPKGSSHFLKNKE